MARARRIGGWVVGVVLLLGVIAVIYYAIVRLAELGPQLELNQVLLPVLAIALVVLALAMAGVLIRNLVRLIVERKRGILGARLRSKLVFFFLALMLLPALVLFSGSVQLLKKTVEGMLRTPVEDVTRYSRAMVDAWNEHLEDDASRLAGSLAGELAGGGLLEAGRNRELREWLDARRVGSNLDWIFVAPASGRAARNTNDLRFRDAGERGELNRVAGSLIAEVQASGEPATRVDYLGVRLVVHAAAPLAPGSGIPAGGVIAVGTVFSDEMAERMTQVDAAGQAFRRFRTQRSDLVRLYLYLIALIFLVTLFAATWLGFYLARRMTDPIQKLAAASREISAGNLGVRVQSEVGDEIGTLVDAFNEMAGQLQENREVITRSTADLRRSNKALDERRRYIETLVANLSTAVITLDRHGRVTTANPAVETMLGVRLRTGDELRPALAGQGLGALVELLDRVPSNSDDVFRGDLVLRLPRGDVSVSVQVSPLRGAGDENLGTLLMVEDLTDLLRAQRAAAWREVARRIAHEIKNPLTPIQLSAERLRKKFAAKAADLDTVVPEATASIEREVSALKRLVDEFSRFARMPDVKPEPVAFREVVDSVLALYHGLPEVRWIVETEEGLDTVTVDAEQMRRALINLIDNAVAAMGSRGTLRIRARAHAGPGSLRIEVADSGPGIPVDDRDKMFAPYFSTKRRGTGLGLAIVHRVVSEHRGTIRVEDNEPHGARFIIEIPA